MASINALPDEILQQLLVDQPVASLKQQRTVSKLLASAASDAIHVLVCPEGAIEPHILQTFRNANSLVVTHSSNKSFNTFLANLQTLILCLTPSITELRLPQSRDFRSGRNSILLVDRLIDAMSARRPAPPRTISRIKRLEIWRLSITAADILLQAPTELDSLTLHVFRQLPLTNVWAPKAHEGLQQVELLAYSFPVPAVTIDVSQLAACSGLQHVGLRWAAGAAVQALAAESVTQLHCAVLCCMA